MQFLKGWNTIIFNVLSAIFGVLESTDFTNIAPAEYQGFVISFIAIVNIYLRARTNTPIGRKE